MVRIRKARWDVLAKPEVLDFLRDGVDRSYQYVADKMFALLARRVPKDGPPRGELSEDIGDDILEFRRQPRKGKKLRVLYFYDEGHVIVCVRAFQKGKKKTPPAEKERAIEARKAYFDAKNRREITIAPMKEMSA